MARSLPLSTLAIFTFLAGSSAASSLSREAIRPALLAAVDEVRDCTSRHYLLSGRYSVWIDVDARGRGRARFRETPAPLEPRAERCLRSAFERQRYPTVGEALVAWSAASPPGRTYSISYPFVLVASPGELVGEPERFRPRPARVRALMAPAHPVASPAAAGPGTQRRDREPVALQPTRRATSAE